ncbi:SRPBCC domain-containing protein [Planococcus shenhongbingii]|uniref:SRPBCC domain-containing protein n=1 Tax=Planococcus shenhongbingii TaxID=3058398 RepID=A0ABT8NEY4_9BACL|nr:MULTISPECIES: SRPBCC domain-containing protein [unclassified Planococcus (in: firmicutes)]MDN7246449.1 SRPBCC domain-containing protein [Planococcus sp. N017]WKA59440.1 SRPBCC domain-containing protein [Planococcus sp. N016]
MSVNKGSNDAFTRVEGLEMVMERFFMAPRELVFTMHTEPEHIKNWWGPVGWTTTTYQMDVRPGGIWHYCMRSADGEEAWGKSVYQEVAKPERLIYEDIFSDEKGNNAEGFPTMKITVEFVEEGNGTRVVSRTLFEKEEDLKQVMDMGVVEGMTETFDRLEQYLNQM